MVDTARRAVAELAASQHRAFTRKQAAELDFPAKRIATAKANGWMAEPTPGVLVTSDGPTTWHQRLMVVILAAGGNAVASHRASARLHRLDGFDSPRNATIEASVQRAFRLDPAVTAVVHHVTPLEPCDVTTVDGIPCTTIPRNLSELGAVVHKQQVQRALTAARRRGISVRLIRTVAERLHRPGPTGTGVLLRLLDRVPWEGTLPQSWFEELLALCLHDPALPEVSLQHPIVNATGRIVARTDIGFPSLRLGLEAHSRRFHFGPEAEPLDEDRDIAAAQCGWELLYLGWYATRRPDAVLRVVKDVVRERQRTLLGRIA
jgi:hypothetical protein